MYSRIQGQICRTEEVGELRLTEALYPAGSSLPEHEHEYGCFGFMLQGELREHFGARGLAYRQSTVFYRPPEVLHRDAVESHGARCLHVEMSAHWLDHVRQYSPILNHPNVLEDIRMKRLAKAIYEEWRELDDIGPLAIEGLAYEMAAHLCRHFTRQKSDTPPRWFKAVQEAIESQFRKQLSLRKLADTVSVHPVHLARQFRKYVGMSVGEFIRSRRVDFARQQLTSTDKPLIDIAFDAGFAHQAHFTTVFKRLTGTTPLEYRKRGRLRSR